MGVAGWERARVLAGRPAVDSELTDLYNPMEAGLCSAVSVTKVLYFLGPRTIWPTYPAGRWSLAFNRC
jgi:hypothetical protein